MARDEAIPWDAAENQKGIERQNEFDDAQKVIHAGLLPQTPKQLIREMAQWIKIH